MTEKNFKAFKLTGVALEQALWLQQITDSNLTEIIRRGIRIQYVEEKKIQKEIECKLK